MNDISKVVIPVFILGIVFYGSVKRVDIYDSFLVGAKEGLKTSLEIFPSIVAMIFAINIFLDSNFLYAVLGIFERMLNTLSVPLEIMPMAFLRPISGSATLSLMNDIFLDFGPDSYIGRLASIIQGCTDTTFYVLALYFGSVRITKCRYALKVGLFADFMGIIFAILLTKLFF